jgi:hypothetical protein
LATPHRSATLAPGSGNLPITCGYQEVTYYQFVQGPTLPSEHIVEFVVITVLVENILDELDRWLSVAEPAAS